LQLYLFNCGNEVEENIIPVEGGIKRGGTYTINETENIRGLDPVGINDVVSHHVAHQIYDLLIDLDSNFTAHSSISNKMGYFR